MPLPILLKLLAAKETLETFSNNRENAAPEIDIDTPAGTQESNDDLSDLFTSFSPDSSGLLDYLSTYSEDKEKEKTTNTLVNLGRLFGYSQASKE